MLDAKEFLKCVVLVGLISALPGFVDVVSARGGGHGTGGSSGSGGGHSSSASSGGHSSTDGHSSNSLSDGRSAIGLKSGRSAGDPSTAAGTVVSNQTVSGVNFHSKDHQSFDRDHFNRVRFNRSVSTGETGQNIKGGMAPNEDWKRRHPHLLFGFLPY
ncbi:MAG: hypothetical protein JO271_00720 [Verrucomicrobia bacterium]|nr:hypothetical protein [Verrucomicrobiota bacterium]MBV9272517.1 hypothetical protein [Verrucomicrobiota bacterium]